LYCALKASVKFCAEIALDQRQSAPGRQRRRGLGLDVGDMIQYAADLPRLVAAQRFMWIV
jgi:hypothetical protein